VDETYVKVTGRWRYVYRAVDQVGQVIDCSCPRDVTRSRPAGSSSGRSARRRWRRWRSSPTKQRPTRWWWKSCCRQRGIEPDQYSNNRVEADHGRLKARRPMRGLEQDRNARIVIARHAFMQNVRPAHYELAAQVPAKRRVAVAFDEFALAISSEGTPETSACRRSAQRNRPGAGAGRRARP
jgi:transposase-like protein